MLLFNSKDYAQTNHWTVKAGESIAASLGDSIIYHYPEFTGGVVHLKNGTLSHASLILISLQVKCSLLPRQKIHWQ